MHRLALYQAFIRLKVLKISDGGVCRPKWDILSYTSKANGALLKRVGRNKEPETMSEINDDGVLRPKWDNLSNTSKANRVLLKRAWRNEEPETRKTCNEMMSS